MALRTYTVVFIDRRLEEHEPAFLNIPCSSVDFWLQDGFWEFRFQGSVPDEIGVTTHFLKIKQHDLIQVVGQSGEEEVGTDG